MLLGPALFGSSAGWALGHQVGVGVGVVSELGVLRAALPLIGGVLLALPMQPPIEHGLRRLLEHRFRQKTIGPAQMPAYTRIKEAGSDGVPHDVQTGMPRDLAPSNHEPAAGACAPEADGN
jgi:hypothetical protein